MKQVEYTLQLRTMRCFKFSSNDKIITKIKYNLKNKVLKN